MQPRERMTPAMSGLSSTLPRLPVSPTAQHNNVTYRPRSGTQSLLCLERNTGVYRSLMTRLLHLYCAEAFLHRVVWVEQAVDATRWVRLRGVGAQLAAL